jgi:hypothetical protein
MRRFLLTALVVCTVNFAFGQADTIIRRSNPSASPRVGGNDHFLIQFGATNWQGKPDSINNSGFSRTFNMYFMFAFAFKTNPQWSVGIGPGIATDHIFFDNTYVGLKDATPTLQINNVSDTSHFKKYKMATAYLEAPVELRFTLNPEKNNSLKLAVGAKVGTLLSAWVKGKTLVDANGNTISDYVSKEKNKRFLNSNRLSLMGRVGFGNFSLFTTYAVTTVFKEGLGPEVRPMTIGLTLSGL